MAPPKDRYIGRSILNGQFKILRKIGTGGMGSVYKASQPEMNRLVAVKILHAKLKDRKDLVSRFRREARAMSHLEHPNTAKVMMYINGASDPSDVNTVQLKLSSISQMAAQDILVEQISASPSAGMLQLPIESSEQTLYNPDGKSYLFMIPGLIPIILQVQALILSALAIVKEREQGTMEQLIVTPIRSWELMLGKLIPYMVVSVFNLFALLWLGQLLFDVHVLGSFWELIGLSLVFILGSLGMGVLISNLSQSQMQAIYMAIFVVLIPAIILSGLMFSRSNMPLATYLYSELLPVTHYLEITRGIMLRGASAATLWASTVPLIVLSVVYFIASVFAFRKRM